MIRRVDYGRRRFKLGGRAIGANKRGGVKHGY